MSESNSPRIATFTTADTTPTIASGPASIRILLDASHGGAYSVIELRAAPGFTGPPMLHHHTREEASFVVLEGALTIATGGVDHRVGPGGLAHLPPGVDFTWRNASAEEPARFLCVYAPAGFEQMFADVARTLAGRAGPLTPAVMREVMPAIWQRYGLGQPT